MSIYSKFFLRGKDIFKRDQFNFPGQRNLKGFFLSWLKEPIFCFQLLFIILFLLVIGGSGLFLENYLAPAILPSQEKLDNLFLGQSLNTPLSSLALNFIEENSVRAIAVSQIPSTKVLSAITSLRAGSFGAKDKISEYIVQPGDSLSKIAEKFGISLNTLLWANDISHPSKIKPGQRLIILPVSGILHYVKKGETISELAELYKGNVEEIIAFNELSDRGEIFVGDLLIIPGGKMPTRKVPARAPSLPLPDTLFICPIPSPCRITQGLHWYNAIDFSNGKCGEPVFAVAGGKVQRTGYQRVAGRYIRILHPSGIVTFYGHLSKISVRAGQRVLQGEIIGYTGYSGYTVPAGPKGCHLHFEVRGARNPFAR